MKSPQANIKEIPAAFRARMAELLREEYSDFLSSLQLPAITGLRVNTLKLSAPSFLDRNPWNLSPVPWCSTGFALDIGVDETIPAQPGKHPYHYAGLYYLQEPSAMAAAEALAPQPGETVLDLAAAPGGKATHLAALMNNTGTLVTNEIHPKRVWDLVENLERCGVTNAVVTNDTPIKLADHFGEYFDRVMLDAPCSGEGMFRKGEIARQEWKPELVRSCALRQSGILEQAARMVKPGGRLVYTTCTFSPDENECVIAHFLTQHPEYDLEALQLAPGFRHARPDWIGLPPDHRVSRAVRIWPHLAQGEGHFIAVLVKLDSPGRTPAQAGIKKVPHSRGYISPGSNRNVFSSFDDFCRTNLANTFDSSRLVISGSYVYHLPDVSPNLSVLRVIHPGWWLGSFQKERFIPSHSLAMGIKSAHALQTFSLLPGDPRLMAYFAGESLSDAGESGWVLLTVDGYPIGWGKRVQNILKNYYPHGLRRRAG